MTASVKLHALIGKLIQKSEAGDLRWEATEAGAELGLADLIVRVAEHRVGDEQEFVLDLLAVDGVFIDRLSVRGPNGQDGPVGRLYQLATDSARSSAIDKLISALDHPPSVDPVATRLVLPSIPTDDDERSIFAAVAGVWVLDYSRGKEAAEITPAGIYQLINPTNKGRTPKYRLRLIAMNRSTKRIEMAKDYLSNGRRLQIEVLELDDMENPKRMSGEAKHDQHQLHYLRQTWS
jgi:hypothetical protein